MFCAQSQVLRAASVIAFRREGAGSLCTLEGTLRAPCRQGMGLQRLCSAGGHADVSFQSCAGRLWPGSTFHIFSGSQDHPRKNLLASWFCFQEALLGCQLSKELGFHLSHCPNVSLEVFSKYLLNRSIKGHQGSKVFIKTAPSLRRWITSPSCTLCCVQEGRRWQVQRHLLEALCSCSSESLMRSHLTLQAVQIFWYFPFADSLLPG